MSGMKMDWKKRMNENQEFVWYDLYTNDLTDKEEMGHASCVYIVWYNTNKPIFLKVGCGQPKKFIKKLQLDEKIKEFKDKGLHITFSHVNPGLIKRVELYLSNTLKPFFKNELLEDLEIVCELPFTVE
jgi:hypothetical protein